MNPLRPFTPEDVVLAGSFPVVFATLIFKHPAVVALREPAANSVRNTRYPFDANAELIGVVVGHDAPMLPVRYFHIDPWDDPWEPPEPSSIDPTSLYFIREPPEEFRAYYDEINLRAHTLFDFLQQGLVIACGHTEDGHAADLGRAVWLHGDYYIHAYQGDVYEGGRDDHLVRRWIGVGFKLGGSLQPVLPSISKKSESSRARKSQAVRAAMTEAGIDPTATSLTPKQIASKIVDLLPDPPHTDAQFDALAKMVSRILGHAS